jgi:c-di-GMP-binding flagellar brake protein YcgR
MRKTMIEKYISVGEKVELYPLERATKGQNEYSKCYLTRINEILSEDRIEILMPMMQSRIVLLAGGIPYTMVIYTPKGLYQCKVQVVDRYRTGNIIMAVVELTTAIKKYQRREYYRYPCAMPLVTRRLEEREKKDLIWDERLPGTAGLVVDIGGGGVRFITIEDYELEELIICCFDLEVRGQNKKMQVLGKVLSKKKVPDEEQKQEFRVQFTNITPAEREEIIQYIFEEERKQRRKQNW